MGDMNRKPRHSDILTLRGEYLKSILIYINGSPFLGSSAVRLLQHAVVFEVLNKW